MANIATSAQAENAQKIMVAATRYVQEHKAPAYQLIEKIKLPKGHKSAEVPKVGQFSFSNLADGQDMTDEQTINIQTTNLTTREVGAKVIVSDKLLRQNGSTSIFSIVGRQAGDGFARKQDNDVTALYGSLNGGTKFGDVAKNLTIANAAACIIKARGGSAEGQTEPFDPTYFVMHPHNFFNLLSSVSVVGGANINPPAGLQSAALKNFFRHRFNGVNFFEDGNLTIASDSSVTGVLAQQDALVALESKSFAIERERDASRRAWELNWVADYNVFELDDQHGAPVTYDATAPNDSA
jgi:hypothetical protein